MSDVSIARALHRWLIPSTLILIGIGCNGGTGPTDLSPIIGNPPLQLAVTGVPDIVRHQHPDTATYVVTIPVVDSTAHRTWRPTVVTLSTDREPGREYAAVPFACLLPRAESNIFPFNFEWRTCDHILVQTSAVLNHQQLADLSRAITGRLVWMRLATSSPGAFYRFQVPIGREAVAEAARRAGMFPFAVLADGLSNDPPCVRSDVVPSPPCPAWHLVVRVPFSYGVATSDMLPVSSGGWLKATYVDADGAAHEQQITVP